MVMLEFLMENIIQKEKSKKVAILQNYVEFNPLVNLYWVVYFKKL